MGRVGGGRVIMCVISNEPPVGAPLDYLQIESC